MSDGVMEPGSIRVLLVGDDAIVCSHLSAIQEAAPGAVLIAEANSPEHAATLAVRLKPHVIIAACSTVGDTRATAIRHLAGVAKGAHVLVVCARPDDEEWLLLALTAGAAGVVSRHATPDELLSAIRAVANDQIVLRPGAVTALTSHARNEHPTEPPISASLRSFARLTNRERSVFRLIAEGYSAPEVAGKLAIRTKTVETYKKRIGVKLGFSHRADYVLFALRVGVLHASLPERSREMSGGRQATS
jgi:two-component system, NarL family, response regulator NreC